MGKDYSHSTRKFVVAGVEMVIEASILGGVHISTLEDFLKENKIVAQYEVPRHLRKSSLAFCLKQDGKKYDILSLFAIAFKAKFYNNGDNAYQCSEMLGRSLGIEGNLDLFTVHDLEKHLKMLGEK